MTDRADETAERIADAVAAVVYVDGDTYPPLKGAIKGIVRAYGDERERIERERYTHVLKHAQSLADEEFGQEVSANDISRLADALRTIREKS